MDFIIRFSLRRPVSVITLLLAIIMGGLGSALFIPVDLLPHITVRNLLIATEYEGISAGEIRKMITIPLEDALVSLRGVKTISSVSRDGISLISIELHWGIDADIALVECREIIDVCFETLPSRCKKPIASKDDAARIETIIMVLTAHDNDLLYVRYLADEDIKPRFQRVQGVGAVAVLGGEKEELKIQVYRDKMEAKRLTLDMVADTVSAANFEYPAGNIQEGEKELLVKTAGLYASLDDIKQTPLVFNENGLVKILDIAEVVRGVQDKSSFFMYEGKPAIKIAVNKKQGSSPLMVSGEIKKELERIKLLYGNVYEIRIIRDEADEVITSLMSLLWSGIIGVGITSLVIYYFFKSIRLSFILASVIPVSALTAVLILALLGKTLNTISLAGIAIGIGMVIDSSAVVLENIQKKITGENGIPDVSLVYDAVSEIKLSNIGSSASTIIVFVPVLFIKGILSEVFSDMAVSIISSIAVSCVLSLTAIPALFMLTYKKSKKADTRIVIFLLSKYRRALGLVIKKPYSLVIIIAFFILSGIIALRFVKIELIPALPDAVIHAEMVFPYGTKIEYLEQNAYALHERLAGLPYITAISLSGGIEKDNYRLLADPGTKAEKIRLDFSVNTSYLQIEEVKKILVSYFQDSRFPFSILERENIFSELFDFFPHNAMLVTAGSPEEVSGISRNYAEDAAIMPNEIVSEFIFTPDRVAVSRFQISSMYAAAVVRNSLVGLESAPYYEGGREIPVKIQLFDYYTDTIEKLESLGVQLQDASMVPLYTLGKITKEQNEKTFYRYNRGDAKIAADIRSTDIAEKDRGYITDVNQLRINDMLSGSVFLLAGVIALLYLVLGAQFESFGLPFLFFISLPPAFSGAFIFLALFGQTLNMNGIIALIILFGISINNAIILYESCILKEQKNICTIIEACMEKFRAILITNSTTIFALAPFAIDPLHKSAQSSLALIIIGGLLASTVIVLFVIPVILLMVLKDT
ncbi:MAG: efflux RND transporter permease subunit [Treponema sp.]|jgi:multidrug efflux pump subunit AcrB|nr:efflux RND transporter permease subunit [Treponema sp.]